MAGPSSSQISRLLRRRRPQQGKKNSPGFLAVLARIGERSRARKSPGFLKKKKFAGLGRSGIASMLRVEFPTDSLEHLGLLLGGKSGVGDQQVSKVLLADALMERPEEVDQARVDAGIRSAPFRMREKKIRQELKRETERNRRESIVS